MRHGNPKTANKVMLIGWDGATFDIIKPLVDEGRLPNVRSIMENGVWGRLESTIPALTPVAWTSISTGVNPGKHGIFDVLDYSRKKHKFEIINASVRKVKPVWSILSGVGRKVGVFNVPLTYPPDVVEGFVIAGMFTPAGAPDFIYPAELGNDLTKTFGKYIFNPKPVDDPSAFLESLDHGLRFREKVSQYLLDRYELDFFFASFMESDRVQHFFWKYLDSSHRDHSRYGDSIARIYERMDQTLGHLLERAGPDRYVMMVSDHGAGPLDSAFFLNRWLQKNNYLYLKDDLPVILNIKKLIRNGIFKGLRKLISEAWRTNFKLKLKFSGKMPLNEFTALIDWEKTIAFSEGVGGGIYINRQNVPGEHYEEVVEDLRKRLKEIRDPRGQRVVKEVYKRNEIYKGEESGSSPDLLILCNEGYDIISPNEIISFHPNCIDEMFMEHRWSARHHQHGIFLLQGPGVKKNVELERCRLIDVAPMVLYLMGEEIPTYMDGEVLIDAIESDLLKEKKRLYTSKDIREQKAAVSLSTEEQKEVADRLKDLGYME